MTSEKKASAKSGGPAWHALSRDAVIQALNSGVEGLSEQEARRRLKQHGYNRLTPAAHTSPLKRFLLQFHNVLIYVLLAAAGITAAIGHWVDSAVIFGVVLINALIGFIQEGKAEHALNAIRNMLTYEAMVLRDGRHIKIPAEELVPGDIVSLESGDKVPADLRLLLVKNLRADESMLTGESVAVEKNAAPSEDHAALGDRFGMAYSSSLITYGTAQGIVVATGDDTEIGRISSLLRAVPQLTTPLLKQIAGFSRWLTAAILILALAAFAYGWFIEHSSLQDLFMSAVGIAVAAIPEGLPAIVTITLAIGVQRMAARNAIIRRLPAVETLGSVTVICSDKTGTLTCNEMTVESISVNGDEFTVEGAGYDPHGDFKLAGRTSVNDHPELRELLRAASLCNNARIERTNGNWRLHGDPTEGALITLAHKAGLDPDLLYQEMPRTDSIPFEAEHRYMATLHHDHLGHAFMFVKGAPERLLSMCSRERHHGEDRPIRAAHWHRMMDEIAGRGQRLLAIAFKTEPSARSQIEFADVENGLTLLGVVGMIDPPRPEAADSVRKCQKAGIRVKMITGDHAATAAAIAAQLHIGNSSVLSGTDIDRLGDDELRIAVRDIDVFARTSPENKLRLVSALQAGGQVVAMTGDGVNDAPALKRADVGVAMGKKGTEVAKEASEMVLADDNFTSIVHAVEEGRSIYENLKKSIIFILPTSGGEALTIAAAIMTGEALPITPVQILWVNMVTAVTLSLTLAFEPTERGIMRRKPRDPNEPLLSGFLAWRILFVSLILVTGTFGLFLHFQNLGASVAEARTIAVNTLVLFEMFYVFNSRFLYQSVLSPRGLFGNGTIWMAVFLLSGFQLAYTYWRPMQALFGSVDLDPQTWVLMIQVASTVFFLVELEKLFIRLFTDKK